MADQMIKGTPQQLAEMLSKLSMKYYSEDWVLHWEFEAWNEIHGDADVLNDSEIKKLKELSERSDGWIVMDYQKNQLTYMSMASWKPHYRKHKPF